VFADQPALPTSGTAAGSGAASVWRLVCEDVTDYLLHWHTHSSRPILLAKIDAWTLSASSIAPPADAAFLPRRAPPPWRSATSRDNRFKCPGCQGAGVADVPRCLLTPAMVLVRLHWNLDHLQPIGWQGMFIFGPLFSRCWHS